MKDSEKRKVVTFKMEKALMAFGTTLLELNRGDNLVLGGSCSLVLHGLKTNKDPEDVDIIIYNPTEKQYKVLDSLKDFNTLDNSYGDGTVYKFSKVKNGVTRTLDILIQNEPLPKNLLWYKNGQIIVRIQNIYTTVKAKASYKRRKDYEDLIALKNLNFNV